MEGRWIGVKIKFYSGFLIDRASHCIWINIHKPKWIYFKKLMCSMEGRWIGVTDFSILFFSFILAIIYNTELWHLVFVVIVYIYPVLLIYIWYISVYLQKTVTRNHIPTDTSAALLLQYRNSIAHGWVNTYSGMWYISEEAPNLTNILIYVLDDWDTRVSWSGASADPALPFPIYVSASAINV